MKSEILYQKQNLSLMWIDFYKQRQKGIVYENHIKRSKNKIDAFGTMYA